MSSFPSRTDLVRAAEACACFRFRRASRAVTRLFDEVLEPARLPSTQFVTLVAVGLSGAPTRSELSALLAVDRTALTRNLAPLLRRGLLRSRSGEDPRKKRITLTPRGRRALERGYPLWHRAQGIFVRGMGRGSWRTLRRTLTRAETLAGSAQT